MKKSSIKANVEPSAASLREIPEVNMMNYVVVGRGTRVAFARKSFEMVALDKSVVTALGGADAVRELLHGIVAVTSRAKKRKAA
jgi:hypothetical protein